MAFSLIERMSPQQSRIGKEVPTERLLLDAQACEDSLALFMRKGWRWADESQEFVPNWHIDCIADHLTAVVDRQLKGPLIFTLPPRHMKSIGINVFMPAWCWAQRVPEEDTSKGIFVRNDSWRGPGVTFAFISYDQELSNRDSVKCQSLVTSDWYQRRWGDRFKMKNVRIEKFTNSTGGIRHALSFSGKLTGFGADLIGIDDAHNVQSDSPEIDRGRVISAWTDALQSRLNNPIKGSMFIIAMQRSHENDLVGFILAREFGGLHVCLPAEHEHNHPHVFIKPKQTIIRKSDSSRGIDGGPRLGEAWEDKRSEGELLWPKRFPVEVIRDLTKDMTSHAAAGQYQQRPSAREGNIFKREWFGNPLKIIPSGLDLVRAWDIAATSEGKTNFDPDYTVGLLMGREPNLGVLYIMDVIRKRLGPGELEREIYGTAAFDGVNVRIRIPQDPAASGKFMASQFVSMLQGYNVVSEREGSRGAKGDKERRAEPLAAQAEHNHVRLIEGPWNDAFMDEISAFPNGAHDDQVDAAAAALRMFMRKITYTALGA